MAIMLVGMGVLPLEFRLSDCVWWAHVVVSAEITLRINQSAARLSYPLCVLSQLKTEKE